MKSHLLSLLIAVIIFSCQSPSKDAGSSHLGTLNHQFNISPEAKAAFEEGLLLLHSFEYDDAKSAFQRAIKADSTELMAYWGEAMTHYRALWGLQNIEKGREVLAKLGTTREQRLRFAKDQLEKDFWQGVEILYGDGELAERNKAYAEHMAGMYATYKGNQEVAAFYALGLMWSVPGGRNPEVFDLSAKIASGILEENPNHPGALHYLIHANDDPSYAKLSKLAADKYSKVAPDATHALHMPSHIYLALGMWNDMVSSNEASYDASVSRMNHLGLSDAARGYHSFAWLHYGYLQQGRFVKANQLVEEMQKFTQSVNNQNTRSYLIMMQAAQLAAAGNIEGMAVPMLVDDSDLGVSSKASQQYIKAVLAFNKNDVTQLDEAANQLEKEIKTAELIVSDNGIAMCSSGATRYAPSKSDIVKGNVILLQMRALKAMLANDDQLTDQLLKEATVLEGTSEYSYGPPDIPYPSYEQYGEWLLSKNRYEEALAEFNQSLNSAKNRSKSLQGKKMALTKLGRTDEANEVNTVLLEFWKPDGNLAMK